MTHGDRAGDASGQRAGQRAGRREAAGDAGHPPSAAAAPLLRRTERKREYFKWVGEVVEVCLANSYYLCKSPSFHRLANPGGNGAIAAHA